MGEKEEWMRQFNEETKNAPNPIDDKIETVQGAGLAIGIIFLIGFILSAISLLL